MSLTRAPAHNDYSEALDYLEAMGPATVQEIATALGWHDEWIRDALLAALTDSKVIRRDGHTQRWALRD